MTTQVAKRKCLNPICPNGGYFIPRRTDAFHCPGCRAKKHNHLRRIENASTYKRERTLRHNAKRLKYIYNEYATKEVPHLIIKHEKIVLTVFTDTGTNPKTDGTVFWSHDYGIEVIAETPTKIYKIHHR